eukprot:951091-Pelagomonas_calceolata.AAC.1
MHPLQASQQLAGPAHGSSQSQPDVTTANKKGDQTRTKTPANITMGGKPASKKGADQVDGKAKQGVTFTYSLQSKVTEFSLNATTVSCTCLLAVQLAPWLMKREAHSQTDGR